jgi:putative transposase
MPDRGGHLMPDHVHMSISIPPKYSVAQIIGYMKGKSSIWIAQNVERKMRNFLGHKFWARGYFVTTIGRDEEMIRAYIRNQELADRELDQFELKISAAPKSNQSSEHPLKPPLAVPNQTSSYTGGYWLDQLVGAHENSGIDALNLRGSTTRNTTSSLDRLATCLPQFGQRLEIPKMVQSPVSKIFRCRLVDGV